MIAKIRQSVIGDQCFIDTPFGEKPLVYADYTASGRALTFIEDIIREQVLPCYANTHTETSYTGAVSTTLREEAREIIRDAVNGSDADKVIFCGSGATSAVDKLVDILNLRLPAALNTRYGFDAQIPDVERPVVFIGPYEHHSNELPWRESIAEVVTIPLDADGLLDIDELGRQLQRYQARPMKIGSFSAASNVTGLKTPVDAVAALLHHHGALSFWDYAAAAPYVGINMQGSAHVAGDTSKDAVFISTHKLIGGPGTPGILVVKEHLLTNTVPAMTGGGTVMYVTPDHHHYVSNPERREEGGTPGIVESIRAGLVFKLQQTVGTARIEQLESDFVQRAIARWSAHPEIEVLGNLEAPRLSIVSFRVRHQDKDLHYGFIVALLNDLFGIQSRGGCSCAGPYGHHLLQMDRDYSQAIESAIADGEMVLRPGWVRVNFNYFIDEATFDYIVRAVTLVAEHGWRLLPFYEYDSTRGLWRYQGQPMSMPLCLTVVDFMAADVDVPAPRAASSAQLAAYIDAGEQALQQDRSTAQRYSLTLSDRAEALRWFVLPQEIIDN